MTNEQTAFKLIEHIYDAPLDGGNWDACFDIIKAAFDAEHAYFYIHGLCGSPHHFFPLVFSCGEDRAKIYGEYYHAINPFRQRLRTLMTGQIATSSELIGDEEYEKTEFHNDFLQPSGVYYQMGSYVSYGGQLALAVNLHRAKSAGAFGEEEKKLLCVLQPHLERAARFQSLFTAHDNKTETSLQALDGLKVGVIFLDGEGRVVSMNQTAKGILSKNDGLRVHNGKLKSADATENSSLHKFIASCAKTKTTSFTPRGGSLRVTRPSGLRSYVLQILSVSGMSFSFNEGSPTTAVVLNDPSIGKESRVHLFQQLYGLTQSEARIADALANGMSAAEIADQYKISLNTLKTHRKHIYSKMDISKQAELVSVAKGLASE